MNDRMTNAVRFSTAFMILATIVFVLVERFWLGKVIPKDFHPTATTAIATAVAWCLFTWISSPFPLHFIQYPPNSYTVGMASASFFVGIVGFLIGLGESGCSAWMLSGAAIVGLIGLGWAWAVRECMNTTWDAAEVRLAIAKRALVLLFLLAPIASYLYW